MPKKASNLQEVSVNWWRLPLNFFLYASRRHRHLVRQSRQDERKPDEHRLSKPSTNSITQKDIYLKSTKFTMTFKFLNKSTCSTVYRDMKLGSCHGSFVIHTKSAATRQLGSLFLPCSSIYWFTEQSWNRWCLISKPCAFWKYFLTHDMPYVVKY